LKHLPCFPFCQLKKVTIFGDGGLLLKIEKNFKMVSITCSFLGYCSLGCHFIGLTQAYKVKNYSGISMD
jgi:hypothetical protein